MEEMNNQAPTMSQVEPEEESELNHTDKLVGVFSEPGGTFAKIAMFPAKTVDWILPVFVMIVIIILGQFVMRTNPEIRQQIKEKQMEQIAKGFDDAVAKGQMTRDQADTQLSQIEENMESAGAFQTIGLVVGTPIAVFFMFFVISGFYLLVSKFGFKGAGGFKDVMVAYGLPYYIACLHQIVIIIAALAMSKFLSGVSAADLMSSDKSTLAGFLLGKIDPFSIWFYIVFGVGLAKMNKSNDVTKYIIAVIGIWIVVGLIFFFVAKAVPFLGFLNQ